MSDPHKKKILAIFTSKGTYDIEFPEGLTVENADAWWVGIQQGFKAGTSIALGEEIEVDWDAMLDVEPSSE